MYRFIIIVITLFVYSAVNAQFYKAEIAPYIQFLKSQRTGAKEYVLKLFEKYDVIVLCERNHGEMTQYDLIYDIVSSEYFRKNGGSVFTEIGGVDRRAPVLKFLHHKFSSLSEKEDAQREMYRSLEPGVWTNTNLYNFLGKLNDLNARVPDDERINLYVSNVRNPRPGEFNTAANYKIFFDANTPFRDSIMANNVIGTLDSIRASGIRKKALIIMNSRHAFAKAVTKGYPKNVGEILANHYGAAFANVLINTTATINRLAKSAVGKAAVYADKEQTLIKEGKWDAAFKILKMENVGFDFKNTAFGNDAFDLSYASNIPRTFSDVFTGFVFYLPIERHIDSYGVKGLVDGHKQEIYDYWKINRASMNLPPIPLERFDSYSTVQTESSYEDINKMIQIRDRWISR